MIWLLYASLRTYYRRSYYEISMHGRGDDTERYYLEMNGMYVLTEWKGY